MNRPDPKNGTRYSDHSGNSSQSALGWNVLAIMFLLSGIAVAGLTIREKITSVPPVAGELPDVQLTRQDPALSVAGQWIPFDAYAAIFAGRDVFKTDEERILESTRQGELAANLPVGSWGDGYQLMGVIVDEDPRAIIKTLNPPGVQALAIGDRLGEATLVNVEENMALFDYQNTRAELRFVEKSAK